MSNLILYPLDYTARSPDNRFVGESIGIARAGSRAFVLRHGAFYTDTLVVRRMDTGEQLTPRTDYQAVQLNIDATQGSGVQACHVLIIEPSAFGVELEVDGQYVGGPHSTSTEVIYDLIQLLNIDNRSVRWGSIIGKPDGYVPAPHLHDIGDVYGFEFLVASLEGIRNAILMGDVRRTAELQEYVDARDAELWAEIQRVDAKITAHIAARGNVHGMVPADINLGNVPNVGFATLQIALDGTSDVHLMSPYLTNAVLAAHTAQRNPHGTRKEDVDLGRVDNFATATIAIAMAGESSQHFLTPAGMAAYVDARLEDWNGPPGTVWPPVASFTIVGALSSPANVPHRFTFTDTSTVGTNAIVSWEWDFGDGTTFFGRSPAAKTYTFEGANASYLVSLRVADADGFTHTFTRNLALVKTDPLSPPVVDFTFSGETVVTSPTANTSITIVKNVMAGSATIASVKLENLTTGETLEHGPDGGPNFSLSFALPNEQTYTYQIRMTATDIYGLSTVRTKTLTLTRRPITIPPEVGINFTGPTTVNHDEELFLTFTDNTTPGNFPITRWRWTFSNGESSSVQNPPRQLFPLTQPGFDAWAELTVTADGVDYTYRRTIPITVVDNSPKNPDATFRLTGNQTVTTGLVVRLGYVFEGSAVTGSITSYLWDFGDGTTSTSATPPTKNYDVLPGRTRTITVKLTVTNSYNLSNTKQVTVTLRNDAPATLPTGNWTYGGDVDVQSPANPSITTSASYTAGDYAITRYSWDWGDGTTSTGANATKTYQIPVGEFDFVVKLTVTSTAGTTAVSEKTIRVTKTEPAEATAAFATSGDTTVQEGTNHSITVTDQSVQGGVPIVSWLWNWGDNTTSSERNPPAKAYTVAAGQTVTRTITLTITDELGRTKTASRTLTLVKTVSAAPTANFNFTVNNSVEPNNPSVTVTDTSTAGGAAITGWLWSWGDGSTSSGRTPPNKTYAIADGTRTFSVSLTVTDALGKSHTVSKDVTVTRRALVPPTANFTTGGDLTVAWNATHQIWVTDTSTPGDAAITGWAWEIAGTAYSTRTPPPTTVAVNPGAQRTITVKLTVTDANGKTNTRSVNFTLTKTATPASPSAGINVSGATTVAHNQNHSITFTDGSTAGGGTINAWEWDFGNGVTSNQRNPPAQSYSVSAGQSRSFTVTLTVRDSNGLSSMTTRSITLTKNSPPTPPTAVINASNYNLTTAYPMEPWVQLSDGSTPGSSAIVSWNWRMACIERDFNYVAPVWRNITTARNPGGTAFPVFVAQWETWEVELTVTDANGLTSVTYAQFTCFQTRRQGEEVGPIA